MITRGLGDNKLLTRGLGPKSAITKLVRKIIVLYSRLSVVFYLLSQKRAFMKFRSYFTTLFKFKSKLKMQTFHFNSNILMETIDNSYLVEDIILYSRLTVD